MEPPGTPGTRNLIYSANNNVSSAVIKCKVGNSVFNALLDSGACCSLIDSQLLKEIGSYELDRVSGDLFDASGNVIPIDGTVTVPVKVIGTKSTHEVM